jgi:hypothetical protein
MREQVVKRFMYCLAFTCLVATLIGCSRSPDLSRIISDHYKSDGRPVQSVTIIGEPQVFPDSYRSPNDAGTSSVVRVRVTFSNGKTEERNVKVFVAKSDGWTAFLDLGETIRLGTAETTP